MTEYLRLDGFFCQQISTVFTLNYTWSKTSFCKIFDIWLKLLESGVNTILARKSKLFDQWKTPHNFFYP